MRVNVLVATHKKYDMPGDSIYLPIHVGKALSNLELDYMGDNSGDNVSNKNKSFCELTGLYWGWKNLDCDYLGLVHYRRHFSAKKSLFCREQSKVNRVLTSKEFMDIASNYDIIVPRKRRYYIESLYSHYMHTHYSEHLDTTRIIISEKYSEYLPYYDEVVNRRWGYMFNMFIMKKELADNYCKWLFDILFELENRIETSDLSNYQGRLYGRVSEIIFNCWLAYVVETKNPSIKELQYIHMEPTNWRRKGMAFLGAKVFNKKYAGSF